MIVTGQVLLTKHNVLGNNECSFFYVMLNIVFSITHNAFLQNNI